MSKLQLKKELKTMSREQLEELILDVYTAVKPAREYFDYFLDPDIERLTEQHVRLINKEMGRRSRGRCKARISVIRGILKDYRTFSPDAAHIIDLAMQTITAGLHNMISFWCNDAFINGIFAMAGQTVTFADSEGMLGEAMEKLAKTEESLAHWPHLQRPFHRAVTEALESLAPGVPGK